MDPRSTPATVFLRHLLVHTIQGRTCLFFSALMLLSGIAIAAFPAQVGSWQLLGAGSLLLAAPIVLFLGTFLCSNLSNFESSSAVAAFVALLGVYPYFLPFVPDSIVIAYLPHPFLIASALLFGFAWWTFTSERRQVKKAHSKTLHPVQLLVESVLLGLAVSGLFIAIPLWKSEPIRFDAEIVSIMMVFGLASAGAYFMAPYMGYNLLSNTRTFSGPAMWFCLMSGMLCLLMGIQAQFGF